LKIGACKLMGKSIGVVGQGRRMAVLGGGTGLVETEAGGGVANLRMASGRRLL